MLLVEASPGDLRCNGPGALEQKGGGPAPSLQYAPVLWTGGAAKLRTFSTEKDYHSQLNWTGPQKRLNILRHRSPKSSAACNAEMCGLVAFAGTGSDSARERVF